MKQPPPLSSLQIEWNVGQRADGKGERHRLQSPFGMVEIAVSNGCLTALGFPEGHRGPRGVQENADNWEQEVLGYVPTGRVRMTGTPFQIPIWRALLGIPAGETRSYGEIAAAAGYPKAARAVGTAIGQNPVSVIVPCHRVIRKDGSLGGYLWGLPVKRALLEAESTIPC